uniref:Putative secreted protein n=1 Tax=Anopheles triannulatus TaxID=58253 RepID=A0A2M4B3V6_9DIPT
MRKAKVLLCLLQLLNRASVHLKAKIIDRVGLLIRLYSATVMGPTDVQAGTLGADLFVVQHLIPGRRFRLHIDEFHPELHEPYVLLVALRFLILCQTFLQDGSKVVNPIVRSVLLVPGDVVEPEIEWIVADVPADRFLPSVLVRFETIVHR